MSEKKLSPMERGMLRAPQRRPDGSAPSKEEQQRALDLLARVLEPGPISGEAVFKAVNDFHFTWGAAEQSDREQRRRHDPPQQRPDLGAASQPQNTRHVATLSGELAKGLPQNQFFIIRYLPQLARLLSTDGGHARSGYFRELLERRRGLH
ncbi:MAG: hypothetical protein WB715_08760 [Roseiarcus sp.]|uniref:hypothetical protein n=1 Tax=Roseiarcus sp. TaxID=1969460 RepID=UPI003C5D1ECD